MQINIQCNRCQVIKPEIDFEFHSLHTGQRLKQCKTCNEKQIKYRKKYITKYRLNCKSYYENNREKISKTQQKRFNTIEGRLKKILSHAKWSVKNNIKTTIGIEFLINLYNKQGGKCALTGIPLIYSTDNESNYRSSPFMVSIDRINSNLGYTEDNIRLVCLIVNCSLNEWGEEFFSTMCEAYIKNKSLK